MKILKLWLHWPFPRLGRGDPRLGVAVLSDLAMADILERNVNIRMHIDLQATPIQYHPCPPGFALRTWRSAADNAEWCRVWAAANRRRAPHTPLSQPAQPR